jgi:hypothetical protein
MFQEQTLLQRKQRLRFTPLFEPLWDQLRGTGQGIEVPIEKSLLRK